MVGMGFTREEVRESLINHKYNDVTATYLLLARKNEVSEPAQSTQLFSEGQIVANSQSTVALHKWNEVHTVLRVDWISLVWGFLAWNCCSGTNWALSKQPVSVTVSSCVKTPDGEHCISLGEQPESRSSSTWHHDQWNQQTTHHFLFLLWCNFFLFWPQGAAQRLHLPSPETALWLL